MTRAVVITGAPGAGKSSPWLSDVQAHEQLVEVVRLQRRFGRRLFVMAATTETEADLRGVVAAIGAERTFVACLSAPGEVVAARVLAREPEAWAGREALAQHASGLADRIPALEGIDLVLRTDGRDADAVAAELHEALAARGMLSPA